MRILHVLDHSIPLHSGYTFRTRNILLQQRKLGWETCHVTGIKQGEAGSAVEVVDDLRFYRTPGAESNLAGVPLVNQLHGINALARRISEVVREEQPDILHAHSPALNGLAALRAGAHHKLPVVYECRAFWEDAAVDHGTSSEGGIRYRMTRALESRVFRDAAAVTTICAGLRGDIIARGIDPQKVQVIPNAVDIDSFSFDPPVNEALAQQLGLSGCTVIGFIGSFYAYEGIPLLLEGLAEIRKSNPEVRLLLVGGGPDETIVNETITRLGLADAVILTGRVPHAEVQDYYSLVDIFVYPRLSMRLTELVTPLKPLEAMAQGRLVVASDVGGHRELIEDGSTGFLFKPGDASALAAAVTGLLSRRDRWPELRLAGRKFVEQERNWAASVARYQPVYGGLL